MKKLFLFLMAFVVTASLLGLRITRAQAAGTVTYERMNYVPGKGIVYVFLASGFSNKEVKEGTSIYVGGELYDLFCWITSDKEHIVCNAQGGLTQYAKQTAVITLLGQTFYVTIPNGHARPVVDDSAPLVCEDGQISGADVEFTDSDFFGTWEEFVEGSTLAEVAATASGYGWSSFEIISDLYCTDYLG